jgi:hypothetical protein
MQAPKNIYQLTEILRINYTSTNEDFKNLPNSFYLKGLVEISSMLAAHALTFYSGCKVVNFIKNPDDEISDYTIVAEYAAKALTGFLATTSIANAVVYKGLVAIASPVALIVGGCLDFVLLTNEPSYKAFALSTALGIIHDTGTLSSYYTGLKISEYFFKEIIVNDFAYIINNFAGLTCSSMADLIISNVIKTVISAETTKHKISQLNMKIISGKTITGENTPEGKTFYGAI